MATQSTPRRFSPGGLVIGLVIAVAVGVAIPYGYNLFVEPSDHKNEPIPPRQASQPPQPPLQLALLGASPGDNQTAEPGPDDAKIVWIQSNATGRRARFLPITIKDDRGADFAFSLEPKEKGLIAVHIKKGYDHQPKELTITQVAPPQQGGQGSRPASTTTEASPKVLGKVTGLPAPVVIMPDSQTTPGMGEVELAPGRGGRIGAFVHFTAPLAKDEGAVLKPDASTFLKIDTSRMAYGLISMPGEHPFNGRLPLPNASMARQVSFEMITYKPVRTVETVTFHTGHIEPRFGQPTFVVDKDETVTTPSGLKVTLIKQDYGPKRQPRKIHPTISVKVSCDTSGVKDTLAGTLPTVAGAWQAPSLNSLGLQSAEFTFGDATNGEGERVFGDSPVATPPAQGQAGTFKMGPTDLTIQVTMTRAKATGTKHIVLPVNHKVLSSAPDNIRGGVGPRSSGPSGAATTM